MSEITVDYHDHEYLALKVIQGSSEHPESSNDPEGAGPPEGSQLSQREIARTLDISLGMTNIILKRLVSKGWLTMHRINGRNLAYALTPDGTRELARRSYRYLRRTIKSVVGWKGRLDRLLISAKSSGVSRIILVGNSQLEFMIDYLCGLHGLGLENKDQLPNDAPEGALVLVGENIEPSENQSEFVSLAEILADTSLS